MTLLNAVADERTVRVITEENPVRLFEVGQGKEQAA
jgi:hypothetical protein